MRKTPLNKIGKIGKRNAIANRTLKYIYNDYGITTCELGFKDCTYDNFLGFAHRHKREWYRSLDYIPLLATFKETLLACNN